MSVAEERFKQTMRTKAALDAFHAYKKFQELIKSGVDPGTAFLQVFCGIYYAVPPVPRPDYFLTVSDLYDAIKDAHAHSAQLNQESEAALVYLKDFLKADKPK